MEKRKDTTMFRVSIVTMEKKLETTLCLTPAAKQHCQLSTKPIPDLVSHLLFPLHVSPRLEMNQHANMLATCLRVRSNWDLLQANHRCFVGQVRLCPQTSST